MTQITPNKRSTLKPPPPNNRTSVGTGKKLLAGVDGRSTIARRFSEIAAELVADRGGVVSEAQRGNVAQNLSWENSCCGRNLTPNQETEQMALTAKYEG